ncbi:glycerophosphodiester phosphodiesterase [Euzebyella marina]|uniref:Glycerophosphodiester phosphodiesterase n=2 Tax=Euzebyella marina TaxID=1761453 RepID=A0A3G2L8J6_9FLAO|nr:glycerophosphodiester phosphodiesterase family protein [Euzebyella marina]AYN68598.1 glycerophosphodiester phosphodiesterase [Euzebyella marina]
MRSANKKMLLNLIRYFLLLVTLIAVACKSAPQANSLKNIQAEFQDSASNKVLVAAHRGAHLDNFENSIASTLKCIELGVDIVEVDVRTTKDGHLVLMHDSSVDRTTNGSGKVEDLTLKQIRSLRLKDPSGKLSKETVPTFEEFLRVTKGKIMVDIDMKTDNVEGIVSALKTTGTLDEVFYFDNDYHQLNRVKELHATAQIMPRAYSLQMVDSAITQFSPPVVHIDDKFYTQEVVDFIEKKQSRVWINTLGDLDKEIAKGNGLVAIKEAVQYGANIIQTDEPEKLLQLLQENGLR